MSRADDLFAEAIELPVHARASFLASACQGEDALRRLVETLLASHEEAGTFLLDPAAPPRPAGPAEEKPGDIIGRYTLVSKLGEGGCGLVYHATQTAPVRRSVALKILKLGMDTREVIARFEGERQALALMDHPHIARVIDAGATDSGRPYFVMELVEGIPITRFCDEHALALPARLELFTLVCLAVQHAHQKGIIHRDLKPSNILVAFQDGRPVPKVIDFGIAKATEGRLTEHTLFTRLGQFIGTPAYMSPEQVRSSGADLDTRSDIYALGVLLYELLIGRLPFAPKLLSDEGLDAFRRALLETEPARPSARLAGLGAEERATAAALRRVTPTQLTTALRGDLDWIALRCLEKDRARRYDTAQSLAEDVRRHLRREPVQARPPEKLYRFGKFVSRNRLACASAAALALALLAGTLVSAWQAVRATEAERAAQRRQDQAEDLLAFMLGDFRTELKKIGRLEPLDTVGAKALAYFEALDPRDLSDSALTQQTKALMQIGDVRVEQARNSEAAQIFALAHARAAAFAARQPRNANALFERAQAEFWLGQMAQRLGDNVSAHRWLTSYRDSAVTLGSLEGDTLRAQRELSSGHYNLAVLDASQGNLAAARTGFAAQKAATERMLVAAPEDLTLRFRLADISSRLGLVAMEDGRYAEALACFVEAASRIEALIAKDPKNTRWALKRAESLIFTGNALGIMGRRAEAAATYSQARPLIDALSQSDPKNISWLLTAQTLRLHQAALLLAENDFTPAQLLIAEVRAHLESIAASDPSITRAVRLNLASAWLLEGRLRLALQSANAAEALARARAVIDPPAQDTNADARARSNFARLALLEGRLAQAENQPALAREHWDRAFAALAPRLPQSNDWVLLEPAAHALLLAGRSEEARPILQRLQRLGYHSTDPAAASAFSSTSSTQNR